MIPVGEDDLIPTVSDLVESDLHTFVQHEDLNSSPSGRPKSPDFLGGYDGLGNARSIPPLASQASPDDEQDQQADFGGRS